MKPNTLKNWLDRTTPQQQRRLAKLAKTTPGNLRQLAGGYRTRGEARARPELARRLEIASTMIPDAPNLFRTDLCRACGQCEFATMYDPRKVKR